MEVGDYLPAAAVDKVDEFLFYGAERPTGDDDIDIAGGVVVGQPLEIAEHGIFCPVIQKSDYRCYVFGCIHGSLGFYNVLLGGNIRKVFHEQRNACPTYQDCN